jgi:hypothetical protein
MGQFNAVFLRLQTKAPTKPNKRIRLPLWRHSFGSSWPAINQPGLPSIIPTATPVNGTEHRRNPDPIFLFFV